MLDNNKLLGVLACGMLLTFGVLVNLRGQVAPLIQDSFQISYSYLGFAFSVMAGGSIIAMFSSGFLIRKFGLKNTFLAGLVMIMIVLIGISYLPTYQLFISAMGLFGIGVGTLSVTSNTLASLIFIEDRGKKMNIFHLFFGIGGIVAPVYAGYLLRRGFGWESVYLFATGLVLCLLLLGLYCEFPTVKQDKDKKKSVFLEVIKDYKVVIFALLFLLYVGTEIGLINWLGIYLSDVQGRSETEISFFLSLFFVLFTVGRLLTTFIVEKIGYLYLVLICGAISGILIFVALVGPDQFAILFSVVGLFMSAIFPTMQAAMFEAFEEQLTIIISLTLAAGSIGDVLLANWLMGVVNDLLGIQFGYGVLIFYLISLILLTGWLKYKSLTENCLAVNNDQSLSKANN
ncbi:MFS transporter [Natroniella sulfidigena]|uniref:MFS transporter n=1 Tax=Natroniella sulfidigena TaxID=723921 RepID=UPI00200A2152|nr:MFS transporter [Natroniella sulfidigena]MCK8816253.1 MFS transporter [Natroniella sulfidigena]